LSKASFPQLAIVELALANKEEVFGKWMSK
jgi:hypothetical protein